MQKKKSNPIPTQLMLSNQTHDSGHGLNWFQ